MTVSATIGAASPRLTLTNKKAIPMQLDPFSDKPGDAIKLIDGKTITEMPAAMLVEFEPLLIEQFGRSLKQIALHRGLTVTEAVDIMRGKKHESVNWRLEDNLDISDEVRLAGDITWWYRHGSNKVTASMRGIIPFTYTGRCDVAKEMAPANYGGPILTHEDMSKLLEDAPILATGTLPAVDLIPTTIPEEDLKRLQEQQRLHGESLVGNHQPTMHLRWAVPEGTHFPSETVLEQRWDAPRLNGSVSSIWKPVERVIVKKEG